MLLLKWKGIVLPLKIRVRIISVARRTSLLLETPSSVWKRSTTTLIAPQIILTSGQWTLTVLDASVKNVHLKIVSPFGQLDLWLNRNNEVDGDGEVKKDGKPFDWPHICVGRTDSGHENYQPCYHVEGCDANPNCHCLRSPLVDKQSKYICGHQ